MNKKPNIILFVTDDHGQWANSSYGNADVHSPSLDFLADNGAVMENAYTPTPVCSPSRACIYTGRISSQHGVHDYLGSGGNTGIEEYPWLSGEKLLSEILHEQGYATGLCGKWHLANESHPQAGFDTTFTIGTEYPVPHYGNHKYFENGNPATIPGYITDTITDRSVQFIHENSADEVGPFFLIVGFTATHHPWEGLPERLVNMYRKKNMDTSFQDSSYPFGIQNLESTFPTRNNPHEALAQYYAAVSHIDEGVGRIVDEVYSSHLEKDTLIVYTSDHGLNCGQHGIWGKGNGTLPLNMVEESIRVPLIFSYPGQITRPQRRVEFVDHTDLFQTILDFSGVELDKKSLKSGNYPGQSFFHNLVNDSPIPSWRKYQFCEYGDVRMIRDQRFKLIRRYPDGPCEFFDLILDPQEVVNLFGQDEYQKTITKMTAEMDAFYSTYEDKVKSGLNVKNLPPHNSGESWRDPRNLH
jgi:choline-sulfatase